jgi:hypothetical protein
VQQTLPAGQHGAWLLPGQQTGLSAEQQLDVDPWGQQTALSGPQQSTAGGLPSIEAGQQLGLSFGQQRTAEPVGQQLGTTSGQQRP